MMMILPGILIVTGILVYVCFFRRDPVMDYDDIVNTYFLISQDEAAEMMEKDDGHIVVDVRTRQEYEEGHIPGAVCIPNEEIHYQMPAELPDKAQIILVYCRSGNRSKQAAQKLADMGYYKVYEFGGINTWKGDIVKEEKTEYIPDTSLTIEVNGYTLYAYVYDTQTGRDFVSKLDQEGKIELKLREYGGFEKTGPLPWSLISKDEQITTAPGDIILYQGDQICLYYGQNTWQFTRIGKIVNHSDEEIREWLGDGDVTVEIFLDLWDY